LWITLPILKLALLLEANRQPKNVLRVSVWVSLPTVVLLLYYSPFAFSELGTNQKFSKYLMPNIEINIYLI
jgi:hypothetical protein